MNFIRLTALSDKGREKNIDELVHSQLYGDPQPEKTRSIYLNADSVIESISEHVSGKGTTIVSMFRTYDVNESVGDVLGELVYHHRKKSQAQRNITSEQQQKQ